MRIIFRPLARLAAVGILLGTACTQAREYPLERLGPAPVLGGGSYSTGGGITVAVELRQINGHLGLCGVWAESRQLAAVVKHRAKDVLSKGTIVLDGRILTQNFDFLRQVAPAKSYAGDLAGCVELAMPWSAEAAAGHLEIRIPRQLVYFDDNEWNDDGGGPRVTFRDKGLPNPALGKGSLLPSEWTNPKPGKTAD